MASVSFDCLTDVLERIVSGQTKSHQLHELLVWNWKAARERADMAAGERLVGGIAVHLQNPGEARQLSGDRVGAAPVGKHIGDRRRRRPAPRAIVHRTIEAEIRGSSAEQRLAARRARTTPLMEAIQLAFCLAHARRKFVEVYKTTSSPFAHEVIERLRAIYAAALCQTASPQAHHR